MYSVSMYILSKFIVEGIIVALQAFWILVAVVGLMGLRLNFVAGYASLLLCGIGGGSMGILLSAMSANNVGGAMVWAPLFLTTIPNGFANPFRLASKLPAIIQPVQFLIPISYAYNLHAVLEFQNLGKNVLNKDGLVSKELLQARHTFWKRADVKEADITMSLVLMFVLFLGYRILAIFLLSINSRKLALQ